jgi:hypothetical protein
MKWWEKEGGDGANTHRLLWLPTHDEGIRQRRSRRSRHFPVYYFFIRRIRLAKCGVGQSTDHTRSWKLNLMNDEPFKPTFG